MNPLEQNNPFTVELMNPNPTSSKTKDGPIYRCSFEMKKEDWENFMDAETKGLVLDAAMMVIESAPLVQVTEKKNIRNSKAKNPYGAYARELKLSSFFRTPKVWAAIGTDKEFREWIQRQPSCVSDDYSELVNGEGRSIAAHVRRSNESGTGYKAEYACVPLSQAQHDIQHHAGEVELLQEYYPYEAWSEEKAKDWFDSQRIDYVSQWAWDSFKAKAGYSSMSEISPEEILDAAQSIGVEDLLP